MATNPTTHRGWGKPTVNGSSSVWGDENNAAWDAADADVHKLLTTAKYAAAGGTADVITAAPDPAYTAYAAGISVLLKVASDNTTGATINVNGLGAKDIKALDGSTLAAGDLKAGTLVLLAYDGTRFLLISQPPKATAAAAAAGTSGTAFLTAKSVGDNYTTSSGVRIFKLGGMMIQAGFQATGSATPTITFPVAFGSAPMIQLTAYSDSGAGDNKKAEIRNKSATDFEAYCSQENSGTFAASTGVGFDWIAIGPVA